MPKIEMPEAVDTYKGNMREISKEIMMGIVGILDEIIGGREFDSIEMIQIYIRIMNALDAKAAARLLIYHGLEPGENSFEAGICIHDFLTDNLKRMIAKREELKDAV